MSNEQGKLFNRRKKQYSEGLDNMGLPNILEKDTIRREQTMKQNQRYDQNLLDSNTTFSNNITEHNNLHSVLEGSSLEEIARTSKTNPYLNKNIKWTENGNIMYVNSQGTAKPYGSQDIYQSTLGKNGCPNENSTISIDLPWSIDYTVP